MAKSKSSGADAHPSDEEISQRAYELFLQRGSAPGHENDDWLQAEAELMEARRSAEAAFGKDQSGSAESTSAESIATDGKSDDSKKTNGRRDGSSSGRRTLRQ